ncbi:hypothetical protein HZI73_04835 [Vallitalea pronyensis]|uniref:DUF4367 domain-containing protein n=1 Tax=Vallitalea pronyensis TaxID=1348613 RepID=A0A8J8SFT3_9FIRM|nr:hypothetical protein [Vallitalea pronyensis]QUI21659.1 hypothetical protein HZI73_04835 [Vallitalea pronyensis]
MKHEKNKVYDELDRRLRAYADNSMNAIPIDETVKDRIWNNLNHDIHEQTMKRRYRVRKTYRLAFIISVVLVLIVSLDLSSNASLFKRLLTTITGETLQFHSRDVDNTTVTFDEEVLNKVNGINEEQGTQYVCPIKIGSYDLENIVGNEINLAINLVDDNNQTIDITQRYMENGDSSIETIVTFNNDFFESEKIKSKGIEYQIFHNDQLTAGIFTVGDIETLVTGSNYNDVIEVLLNMRE